METEAVATPVGFLSHDGASSIKGLLWKPAEKAGRANTSPRGIVQLVHGMSEYVGRYDEFARFLVSQGFVVCGSDHVGHGKSVTDLADLGHMPTDGKQVMIEDVHQLRTLVSARYARNTPYFIFGHSMGSFVARAYAARYGEGLAGTILCGTGNQPYLLSKGGNVLAHALVATKGPRHKSGLLDSLGAGAFAKKLDNPRTSLDWLSYNPDVVDAYIADELCGVTFSTSAYAALTDLTAEIVTRQWAAQVPVDMPVLFIAGADDPVGSWGKDVKAAASLLRDAGLNNIEVILYQGMRHEILNEDGRGQVHADVLEWIEGCL